MADIPTPSPIKSTLDKPNITSSATNFLADATKSTKNEDALYHDFFQEGNDGNIVIGTKSKRSGLEIFVAIMQYVVALVVFLGILGALHVFVRNRENSSFFENYPFLCPYLNYDVKLTDAEKKCKSVITVKKEYDEKYTTLQEAIITGLTEYIPIRVSSNILDASPERQFAINTFNTKPHINDVINTFEAVKKKSQYSGGENIECTGITVTDGSRLSTQCSVYGGSIGDNDTNGSMGSARIEALHFIENIASTTKSYLILENPPTSMSIETLSTEEAEKTGFKTKTTLPIQVRYVPLNQKP